MTYVINDTITDIPSMFVNVSQAVANFGNMLLVFVWFSISILGYMAQDRKTYKGNIPMWLTVGGFITTTLAFILFIIPGILSLYSVIICTAIFLACVLWFLFSGQEN